MHNQMKDRFRGFLPIVVDIETAGFNAKIHSILEIAAVMVDFDDDNQLYVCDEVFEHIIPEEGTEIDEKALEFNKIQPFHPFRMAKSEYDVIHEIFGAIRKAIKFHDCKRAVMVAHNANFDHGFIMQGAKRQNYKRIPFHPFTVFDTASLAGVFLGQTVLARACEVAGIAFDQEKAHGALYDAKKTAELFCHIVNKHQQMGGWPL